MGDRQLSVVRRLPSDEVLVATIVVLAAGLRFGTLNVQSVWLDEAATIHLVHRGLGGLFAHLSTSESAPPLYYTLVWGWTKIFGSSPVAFRSFSTVAGLATIPVAYAAGQRISRRAGLWCAVIVALSPIMLFYSQEGRAYALLILLSSAAFVAWLDALDGGSTRALAAWGVLSSLALLTHYFAIFPWIPETVILARRLDWRRLAAPVGSVVVVGAALVPLAIRQRSNGNSDWIAGSSLVSRMAQVPKQFLVGLNAPLELYAALLAGFVAIAAVVALWRHTETRQRRLVIDIAIVGVVALIIPALLAITHLIDIFNGRNLIEVWTPWAVLVAGGLAVIRSRPLEATIGLGLCAVSAAVIVGTLTMPAYQRDDWRGAARAMRHLSSQPRVVVTNQNGIVPLSVYLPTLRYVTSSTVRTREVDFVSLRTLRTAQTPLAASAPREGPLGFKPASGSRTITFAVTRFVAPDRTVVSVGALRRASGDPHADIALLP